MGMLRKPTLPCGNGSVGQPDYGSWATTWPALGEFVASAVWEDGSPRIPGTLMVLFDQGLWKLWLHDRSSNLSSFVSGHSPDQVFGRAEECLRASSLEWRSDRKSSGGRTK